MNTFEKCIIKPGTSVDLNKISTDETFGWTKDKAKLKTKDNLRRISELQELLQTEGKRGFLIVLQAMDAGGKDGAVRTIGSAMNPAGARAYSFKSPTKEELSHHFLWRVEKQLPKAGEVVIFNRSQYEEVGIVRVHNLVPENIWRTRYAIINDFEEKLAQPSADIPEGTHVLKFFLHISKDEQLRRLRDRLDDPAKQWKINESDFQERAHWGDYIKAYSEAITKCSTAKAPWHIIPADKKWMRDLIISQVVADYLEGLHMQLPKPSADIGALRKKYFPDDASSKQQPPSRKMASARKAFRLG